jgi:hypothetical protein
MSHDKIRVAARKRMAQTGEPYATARREVIKEHQQALGKTPAPGTGWFAISFSKAGFDRITAWLETLFGGGPGRSGVQVGPGQIRVRMADFKLTVPRRSVQSARRSQARLGGTTGVHASRGQLLVNGSADGLVELTLDPPCYTGRTLNTMFVNQKVTSLIVSLADPDGFIAAVESHSHTRGRSDFPGSR